MSYPLFPLNTVLFPGCILDLQIFEARYLDMVSACMRRGEGFGVVALLEGREVGEGEVTLALELMDEVLTEVYEGPARVERAKARKRDLSGKAQARPTTPAVRSGAEIPGRS